MKVQINFSEDINGDSRGFKNHWEKEHKKIEQVIGKTIIEFPIIPQVGMFIKLNTFDFGFKGKTKEILDDTLLFKIRWIIICKGYIEVWCNNIHEDGD